MADLSPDYWKAHTPKRKGPFRASCFHRVKRQRGMYNRTKAYRDAYMTARALLNFQNNLLARSEDNR